MATTEKFLTAEEASAALAEKGILVSKRTLLDQACARRCPSRKLNGKRRFLFSEVFAHYSVGDQAEAR